MDNQTMQSRGINQCTQPHNTSLHKHLVFPMKQTLICQSYRTSKFIYGAKTFYLQAFRCLDSTQRKDGASKTSPTCYPPNSLCSLPHTNTHQRSQAVHSSKAEWNRSVPLYQQGRLSLEDTNSILSPYYHLNAWEPAPLHTTERAQRQLLAH